MRRLPEPTEVEQAIRDLATGVTEISIEPAVDTPELRAVDEQWSCRVDHHDLACDEGLIVAVADAGVVLISWRDVRDAQRAGGS